METGSTKTRLDELLVARGLYASRSRARDAIARGTVRVDGQTAAKPGQAVAPDCRLEVEDAARAYVSRAALKLIAGLERFGFDPSGRDALDLGASTGGFTQVLLERGVRHVVAVDVGRGQMDPDLATDPRVTLVEGLNARDLTAEHLVQPPDLLVCDVSFISIVLALPPALDLAAPGACAVILVKPQFEAGREAIGKGGLLRDPADGLRIAHARQAWLDGVAGWRTLGIAESPVEGGDGNREFLLGAVKDR